MEQYDKVFEYTMLGEVFDFQAPNEKLALRFEEIAIEHFRQKLGDRFRSELLVGPRPVVKSPRVETAA